jgi:hypothetical protein
MARERIFQSSPHTQPKWKSAFLGLTEKLTNLRMATDLAALPGGENALQVTDGTVPVKLKLLLQLVEILIGQRFHSHQLCSGRLDCAYEFIQFKLHNFSISVLSVLDQKND